MLGDKGYKKLKVSYFFRKFWFIQICVKRVLSDEKLMFGCFLRILALVFVWNEPQLKFLWLHMFSAKPMFRKIVALKL